MFSTSTANRTPRIPSTSDSTHRDTPRSWIVNHYPALDGLRAIAILLVFVHHYQPWGRYCFLFWGLAGVDIFFVLSGFLITGILFDSLHRPHFFKNFYIRRALRIFPLFYAIWIVLFLLTPVLKISWNLGLFTNLLYISNWFPFGFDHATVNVLHVPAGAGRTLVLSFHHFWTLCVEEQFYLFWPLVLFLVKDRKSMMRVCVIACVAILALRIFLFFYVSPALLATSFLYDSTYTRVDTLIVGAWFALWLRGAKLSPRSLRKLALWLIFPPLAVILFVHYTFGHYSTVDTFISLTSTYEFTLIALICAGILLLTLDTSTRFAKFLMHPWLTALGRISYGVYIFHYLPPHTPPLHVGFMRHPFFTSPAFYFIWVAAIFVGSCTLAWLSFRYFESPILRLKNRLAPTHPIPRPRDPIEAPRGAPIPSVR